MRNQQISKNLRNPGKMYIKMTNTELISFFAEGFAGETKDKCKKTYAMSDFRRGILQINQQTKNDINVHTTDLMLFALGKIEELENIIETKNNNEGKED